MQVHSGAGGFSAAAKCVCHLSAEVLNLLHGTNPRRCGSRGKISLAGGLQQGCCSRGVAAGVHTIRGAVAVQCSPRQCTQSPLTVVNIYVYTFCNYLSDMLGGR